MQGKGKAKTNMFRKWLSNLVNEVLAQQLLSIHTLLGEVLMNQAKILNEVEKRENEVRAQAHDGSGIQDAAPVQTSRQSWPRMKRHLEEADVRKILEEQRDSKDYRAASQLAGKMSEEAERVERYWRNKSARASNE